MNARELYDFLDEFGSTRDYIFEDLINAVNQYVDETGDDDIESVYYDHIVDTDAVYDMINQIMNEYSGQDALIYLYNFIGNAHLATDELFYLDSDGTLEDINGNNVHYLVQAFKEYLEYNTDVLD